MADNISVSGPIDIQSDSKERVAYDLMLRIAHHEKADKGRRYYLELYSQCRQVVDGVAVSRLTLKLDD